jgi:hypothetical protein
MMNAELAEKKLLYPAKLFIRRGGLFIAMQSIAVFLRSLRRNPYF